MVLFFFFYLDLDSPGLRTTLLLQQQQQLPVPGGSESIQTNQPHAVQLPTAMSFVLTRVAVGARTHSVPTPAAAVELPLLEVVVKLQLFSQEMKAGSDFKRTFFIIIFLKKTKQNKYTSEIRTNKYKRVRTQNQRTKEPKNTSPMLQRLAFHPTLSLACLCLRL